MAGTPTADERKERLRAAIAAAQARLQARRDLDGESIGAVLGMLNDDLDQIMHDRDDADRALDRIEARLAAERIRIEDDLEDEDR